MPGSSQFERTLEVAQRDAQACDLRQAGLTYRQIGERLGLSTSAAHTAVQRALAEVTRGAAGELRDLEAARLDMLWRAAITELGRTHPLVQQGRVVRDANGQPLPDPSVKLAAVTTALRVSERRARLFGLDAPAETKVTVTDVVDERVVQLATELELMARLAAAVEEGAAAIAGDPQG